MTWQYIDPRSRFFLNAVRDLVPTMTGQSFYPPSTPEGHPPGWKDARYPERGEDAKGKEGKFKALSVLFVYLPPLPLMTRGTALASAG